MNKLQRFEAAAQAIRDLDFQGHPIRGPEMYRQFQRRNSFGIDPSRSIHRIFQRDFLAKDIREGCLTLPKASATVWSDDLENPLAEIREIDSVSGADLHLGSLVSSFHALCWTHRKDARASDWSDFAHGKDAVRISTTAGKLMDRVMRVEDPAFAQRAWLVEVDYEDPSVIQAMQNPAEVYRRMDSQGALLALSAAIVRTKHADEDEIRLLIDPSVLPRDPRNVVEDASNLLRIPFDWLDFIDYIEGDPFGSHF